MNGKRKNFAILMGLWLVLSMMGCSEPSLGTEDKEVTKNTTVLSAETEESDSEEVTEESEEESAEETTEEVTEEMTEETTKELTEAPTETPTEAPPAQVTYIVNKNSGAIHVESCSRLPMEKNRLYFDSREAVINAGYDNFCYYCCE